MKQCLGCNKNQALENFYKQSATQDGYTTRCKKCLGHKGGTDKNTIKFDGKTKTCSKCKKQVPVSDFYKGTDKYGYSTYCKPCMNLYYASRYAHKTERMYSDETHKQCRLCRGIKPKTSFDKRKGGGPESYCQDCRRAYSRKRNIEQHGITVEMYSLELERIEGACSVCRRDLPLQIDHDHSCCPGARGCRKCIRGLICSHCNRTLGMADDDPDILRKLAIYLESGERPFS